MFKKFFNYPMFLVLFLSFIGMMGFGAVVKYHYTGGYKYQFLQKFVMLIADVPENIKKIIFNEETGFFGELVPIKSIVHKNLKVFDKKLVTPSPENLILISRHDGDLGRSIVEIRDLNTFEVLHSYKPNIREIYKKIDLSKDEFTYLKNLGLEKFYMWHPSITYDGELIFQSNSPLVKIDFNSNIIWVNDEDVFHHSINLDDKENIYVPSQLKPYSELVSEYVGLNDATYKYNFLDDAINILDKNGKILFSKSVTEILIEHGYLNRIFSQASHISDPIHLNDIQPVLKNTKYFKKGDVFLSLRNLSMVILYRPSTNKIIKIIEGEFYNQHDVDILDESKISIYNNNVIFNYKNGRKVKNNEIVIYDFETDTFSKKFEKTFITNKIDTNTHGLVDFLKDGSAIVEDRNKGRIFYLNSKGDVVWIFNNLDSKKQIYDLWWARLLNLEKSKKIRELIKNG